jgi:hypothetical protein
MAKYFGSQCKGNCDGHKAGARYARGGGRKLTSTSSSFNSGMRIVQKQAKNQGTVIRLRQPKK